MRRAIRLLMAMLSKQFSFVFSSGFLTHTMWAALNPGSFLSPNNITGGKNSNKLFVLMHKKALIVNMFQVTCLLLFIVWLLFLLRFLLLFPVLLQCGLCLWSCFVLFVLDVFCNPSSSKWCLESISLNLSAIAHCYLKFRASFFLLIFMLNVADSCSIYEQELLCDFSF